MMADTWHLFGKYMRITLRMPMWTFFTLIQPLIWLVIFGQLFRNMYQASVPAGGHYMDFLVPGIVIMTVLFGSAWSGVSLLRDITSGTVDRMLVSPVSRIAIVLSRVLHSAAQVVVQAIIILVLAVLLGAKISLNPLHLGMMLMIVMLLGIAFASISNGLAILLQREEPLVAIGNLMTLPLMLFSSALMPAALMPEWIRTVARFNPIDHAVEAVRSVLVAPADLGTYMTGFGVITVFAIVTTAWAINAFNSLRD